MDNDRLVRGGAKRPLDEQCQRDGGETDPPRDVCQRTPPWKMDDRQASKKNQADKARRTGKLGQGEGEVSRTLGTVEEPLERGDDQEVNETGGQDTV